MAANKRRDWLVWMLMNKLLRSWHHLFLILKAPNAILPAFCLLQQPFNSCFRIGQISPHPGWCLSFFLLCRTSKSPSLHALPNMNTFCALPLTRSAVCFGSIYTLSHALLSGGNKPYQAPCLPQLHHRACSEPAANLLVSLYFQPHSGCCMSSPLLLEPYCCCRCYFQAICFVLVL